ncbi:hypothetical protein, partial [Sphingobium bisphenolivorans]|uniref:hypothetical protein n=1 Tax=Sphingobium bisphenolivorans TaxID=1335760 RepID=UPI001EE6CF6E
MAGGRKSVEARRFSSGRAAALGPFRVDAILSPRAWRGMRSHLSSAALATAFLLASCVGAPEQRASA